MYVRAKPHATAGSVSTARRSIADTAGLAASSGLAAFAWQPTHEPLPMTAAVVDARRRCRRPAVMSSCARIAGSAWLLNTSSALQPSFAPVAGRRRELRERDLQLPGRVPAREDHLAGVEVLARAGGHRELALEAVDRGLRLHLAVAREHDEERRVDLEVRVLRRVDADRGDRERADRGLGREERDARAVEAAPERVEVDQVEPGQRPGTSACAGSGGGGSSALSQALTLS